MNFCFLLLIPILVLIVLIFIRLNSTPKEKYRHNIVKRAKASKITTTTDPCKLNEKLITNYQANCDQGTVQGDIFKTKCHGKEKSLHLKECINFEKKDWKNWTILNTNIGLCENKLRCETKSYP